MQAWVWWSTGLLCLGLETVSAGSFVFLFFGVGALAVAAASSLGLVEAFLSQSIVFVVVASGSMGLLRRRLRVSMQAPGADEPGLHGATPPEMAMAAERIVPGAVGQVELRGTVWKGLNVGSTALQVGQSYRVIRIDNLTVILMDRGPQGELQ